MIGRLIKFFLPYAVQMGLQRKQPQRMVLSLIAAVLILVAVIFALIALHQYLLIEQLLSIYQVNGLFALGFIALALVCLLISAIKKPQAKKNPVLAEIGKTATDMKEVAQYHLKNPAHELQYVTERGIQRHAGKALTAAILAGLIMGIRTGRK